MEFWKKLWKKIKSYRDIKFLASRIAIIYFIIGVIWVLVSDSIARKITTNLMVLSIIATSKGWIYVLITSILLYKLISHSIKKNINLTNELKNSYDELSTAEEELRAQLDEIQYHASHDNLTTLYSRAFFIEKLDEIISAQAGLRPKIAVMYLDIDDFKNVNDIFGHNFGDKVLVLFSDILSSLIGTNGFMCRMGGDGFLVAINDWNGIEDINGVIKKILNCIEKPLKIDEKKVDLEVSIGVAMYPRDGENAILLIKNADIAMYEAKKLGKKRVCMYDNELEKKLIRRTKMAAELSKSIDNNSFDVYYQPKIDCKNNSLAGFEALLRWNSSEFGMVSPAEFIPVAEEAYLITKIGNWVIKKVCEQIKVWEKLGHEFSTISINVSAVQFLQHDFVSTISQLILDSGVEPSKIEIEITETVIMNNISENVDKLLELKKMGIKVSLDDFGTGYSSLNYLRKIPIDTIKIDKSFIDNIGTNHEDRQIAKLIIEVAHELKYDVVVEGVETSEQLEILKSMDCDKIQGYYFSKPLQTLKAEEFMVNANSNNSTSLAKQS